MNAPPFFIVGSPRSGTTILRDVLRIHPNLESPEETSFFRWAEAFGSPEYTQTYSGDETIKHHRQLDGVSEEEFAKIMEGATSRRDLQDRYMNLVMQKKGSPHARWFDKTPQNIYGVFLLASTYHGGKFVHIHRHPYEVIASLKEGKAMASHSTIGAINVWVEAMTLANLALRIWKQRFYEIRFKDFIERPAETMANLLEFLEENPSTINIPRGMVKRPGKQYKDILTPQDVSLIRGICSPLMKEYDYPEDY